MHRFPTFALSFALALPAAAAAGPLVDGANAPAAGLPIYVPVLELAQAGDAGARAFSAPGWGNPAGSSVSVVVGAFRSYDGSRLTLAMPDGTTGIFEVRPLAVAAAAERGVRLAVRMGPLGDVISVARADQTVRGVVQRIVADALVLQLAGGQSVVVNIAAQRLVQLHLTPGSQVTLTTHDGGKTSVLTKP